MDDVYFGPYMSIDSKRVSNKVDNFLDEYFVDELVYVFEIPKIGIFLPNEDTPFEKEKNKNKIFVDLLDIDMGKEIDWFKKRYEKLILGVEEKFSSDLVKIRWGAINW